MYEEFDDIELRILLDEATERAEESDDWAEVHEITVELEKRGITIER